MRAWPHCDLTGWFTLQHPFREGAPGLHAAEGGHHVGPQRFVHAGDSSAPFLCGHCCKIHKNRPSDLACDPGWPCCMPTHCMLPCPGHHCNSGCACAARRALASATATIRSLPRLTATTTCKVRMHFLALPCILISTCPLAVHHSVSIDCNPMTYFEERQKAGYGRLPS